jgi:hypothetical protein
MEYSAKSIRPFIGSKDYQISRNFYRELGFVEVIISTDMSLFRKGETGFYLQDYYVKDWLNNTMLFLEIEDVPGFWDKLLSLNLTEKYKGVKLSPIRTEDWGRECFVHDPAGNLWHFGEFF